HSHTSHSRLGKNRVPNRRLVLAPWPHARWVPLGQTGTSSRTKPTETPHFFSSDSLLQVFDYLFEVKIKNSLVKIPKPREFFKRPDTTTGIATTSSDKN